MASKFGQNQLIMKPTSATIALLLAIFLGSCTSFSKTSHLFEFYGSTQESYGRDFFYVQYGVTGAATATYTSRGGGYVREGLIADAKKNLIKAHPLGPNQSYVNMSIDISKTESGPDSDTVSRIELTATISADVIQFGQPPLNYEIPVAGSSSLVSGKSLSLPSSQLAEVESEEPALEKKESKQKKAPKEKRKSDRDDGAIKVGDLVSFSIVGGDTAEGEVKQTIQTPNGVIVVVNYFFEGESKTSTLPISLLRKVTQSN